MASWYNAIANLTGRPLIAYQNGTFHSLNIPTTNVYNSPYLALPFLTITLGWLILLVVFIVTLICAHARGYDVSDSAILATAMSLLFALLLNMIPLYFGAVNGFPLDIPLLLTGIALLILGMLIGIGTEEGKSK